MNNRRWQKVEIDGTFESDPRAWLAAQAAPRMPWLLAHMDDGIIWGKRQDDGTLRLSSDCFGNLPRYPELNVCLRAVTLQQVRLFGIAGELLIWRTGNGFSARRIQDEKVEADSFEEDYLLWQLGEPLKIEQGFALLQEGRQGQRHAPPIVPQRGQRPALKIRHYLDYDEEGQAYISTSRLVNLEVKNVTQAQ